jgi:hypothetical protein
MPLSPRRRRALPLLAGVAISAAGCDLVTYRPPVGRDFGAPYAVVAGVPVTISPGRVVETPALDAERRLFVVVEYEGGCNPHSFAVASDASADDRTLVWLVHDDGGDRCEDLVRDTAVVGLGSAYRPGPMALEMPQGEVVLLTLVGGG